MTMTAIQPPDEMRLPDEHVTVRFGGDALAAVGERLSTEISMEAESLAKAGGWGDWLEVDLAAIERGLTEIRKATARMAGIATAVDQAESFNLTGRVDDVQELLLLTYETATEGCHGMTDPEANRRNQRAAVELGNLLDTIGWTGDTSR